MAKQEDAPRAPSKMEKAAATSWAYSTYTGLVSGQDEGLTLMSAAAQEHALKVLKGLL